MRGIEILLIIITGGVVFVNGWTDAPNAIAGAVAAKAVSFRAAVRLAAVCNLCGLLAMSALNASVAQTVTDMANFGGQSAQASLAALLSAMAAIVGFSVAAWRFGIPTSESHALIAALSGAALALGGDVNANAWKKVLAGLVTSVIFGFFSGLSLSKSLGAMLRRLPSPLLDKLQIFAAGGMAFMHGAQDGQKFVAVFVLADTLAKNGVFSGTVSMRGHIPALLFCAVVMALGTSVGGKRIVETVGGMVPLKKHQSVCADLGSGLCLLFSSFFGIPVSTTHTKTTAIMGAGISGTKKNADFKIIGGMFIAWGITFPVCGALGYILTAAVVKFFY